MAEIRDIEDKNRVLSKFSTIEIVNIDRNVVNTGIAAVAPMPDWASPRGTNTSICASAPASHEILAIIDRVALPISDKQGEIPAAAMFLDRRAQRVIWRETRTCAPELEV
jgi:hypothetical protein